eukprot:2309127-Amphidinium_carterae.1
MKIKKWLRSWGGRADSSLLDPYRPSGDHRRSSASDGGAIDEQAQKRLREDDVLAIEHLSKKKRSELDLHELPEYSLLEGMDEIDDDNNRGFNNEEVRVGKVVGLKVLDDFSVYQVVPTNHSHGKKCLDVKWEIGVRGGKLKCRVVAREFRFLEERDDTFAPASLGLTGRFIDFMSMKDSDPSDPMVVFIADAVSAFLQAPQVDEVYVYPPKE